MNIDLDLVVGIPSYNEEKTISFVTRQVDKGISKYFSPEKSLIIDADGGSTDNTKKVFMNTKTKTKKLFLQPSDNITGKGCVLKLIFNEIKKNNASIGITVDADLHSITPEWIKHMALPIKKGYDFSTPLYSRHKYDGTITNNICYPAVVGLFGKNIRQPIGGDFSFSNKIVNYWLEQKWYPSTYKFGIDIFMTLNAVLGHFKVSETNLLAKKHKPSAPNLCPMFLQVVGTLFNVILDNNEKWLNGDFRDDMITSVPVFGFKGCEEPQELDVNPDKVKYNSYKDYISYKDIVEKVLDEKVFSIIDNMYNNNDIFITDELWVRIFYDFLISYYKTGRKDDIINAFRSMYFARVYSFIEETLNLSQKEAEQKIRDQAVLFFKNKNYIRKQLMLKTKIKI
ncbi:glycosyltransferase [Candidatus Woesearchaeota archaeon]|nr:glycosyltransferase [Candidatus Woesearchaeota archaeon]